MGIFYWIDLFVSLSTLNGVYDKLHFITTKSHKGDFQFVAHPYKWSLKKAAA
jgi:hypothetical protein